MSILELGCSGEGRGGVWVFFVFCLFWSFFGGGGWGFFGGFGDFFIFLFFKGNLSPKSGLKKLNHNQNNALGLTGNSLKFQEPLSQLLLLRDLRQDDMSVAYTQKEVVSTYSFFFEKGKSNILTSFTYSGHSIQPISAVQ